MLEIYFPFLRFSSFSFHSFWLRCLQDCSSGFQSRFVKSMTLFLDARRQQARHRDTKVIPSLDSYINIRRNTSGLKPLIDFLEYTLQINLPDEVITHPILEALKLCTNDFVTWSNVRTSFPRIVTQLTIAALSGHLFLQQRASSWRCL